MGDGSGSGDRNWFTENDLRRKTAVRTGAGQPKLFDNKHLRNQPSAGRPMSLGAT